ncbi:uncharacterized protein LOC124490042 [Dermatophagoides farinae]|uniref:Uncharacterized protein n=1 Tax=Dermatophagoides farinae TaxID=6954 RepID=A0A922I9Y7_DERFA|nr:uncharacterized protein LOC124490042 [Dermatophagoides farinae]KAH7639343.1 hypothetical protein HUG17_3376 [Dermatophagoides farinae]KAH9522063.1 hypothetical protein DERF_005666 [Dermatophagoides farinae]
MSQSNFVNFKRKQLIAIEINWRADPSLKVQDFHDKWLKKFGNTEVIDRNLAVNFLQKLNTGEYDDAMNVPLEQITPKPIQASNDAMNGDDDETNGGNDALSENVATAANDEKEVKITKRKNQKMAVGKTQKAAVLKAVKESNEKVEEAQQPQLQEKSNKRPKRNNAIVEHDETETASTSVNEQPEQQQQSSNAKGLRRLRKEAKNSAVDVIVAGDTQTENRKLRGKKKQQQQEAEVVAQDEEEIVKEPAVARRGRPPRKPRN